jgi:uncharacterized protein (DUF433 family)
MKSSEVITVDKEILGGQPVFKGTRVPVESLFNHLEQGVSLDDFLEDFPSVTRTQAILVLEMANKIITSANIDRLYETVA